MAILRGGYVCFLQSLVQIYQCLLRWASHFFAALYFFAFCTKTSLVQGQNLRASWKPFTGTRVALSHCLTLTYCCERQTSIFSQFRFSWFLLTCIIRKISNSNLGNSLFDFETKLLLMIDRSGLWSAFAFPFRPSQNTVICQNNSPIFWLPLV